MILLAFLVLAVISALLMWSAHRAPVTAADDLMSAVDVALDAPAPVVGKVAA